MNTHPDLLWELVRDRQARLREEADQQNQASLAVRSAGLGRGWFGASLLSAGRRRRRWVNRFQPDRSAGTLAPCAPAGLE